MISLTKANSFAFLSEENMSVKFFVRSQDKSEEMK
jgi:hypothetical protein